MKRLQKRPRTGLYITLLLLAVAAMAGIKQCSKASPFVVAKYAPAGGDTIDVAIEYSPVSYYMEGDSVGGFAYNVLREMERSGNFKFKFHPVSSYANALRALNSGDYDLVVGDIGATTELGKEYLLSEPLYLDHLVLVQHRGKDGRVAVTDALQLAGRKVTISRGSAMKMRLENIAEEIGEQIIIEEDSVYGAEQLFLMVASGEIEMAVINEAMAKRLAQGRNDVDVNTDISFTQFQSWVMRKDDVKLKHKIDSALVELKKKNISKNFDN